MPVLAAMTIILELFVEVIARFIDQFDIKIIWILDKALEIYLSKIEFYQSLSQLTKVNLLKFIEFLIVSLFFFFWFLLAFTLFWRNYLKQFVTAALPVLCLFSLIFHNDKVVNNYFLLYQCFYRTTFIFSQNYWVIVFDQWRRRRWVGTENICQNKWIIECFLAYLMKIFTLILDVFISNLIWWLALFYRVSHLAIPRADFDQELFAETLLQTLVQKIVDLFII